MKSDKKRSVNAQLVLARQLGLVVQALVCYSNEINDKNSDLVADALHQYRLACCAAAESECEVSQ